MYLEPTTVEIKKLDSTNWITIFMRENFKAYDSTMSDTAYFLEREISSKAFEEIQDLISSKFNEELLQDTGGLDGTSIEYYSNMNGYRQSYSLWSPTRSSHPKGFQFTIDVIEKLRPLFEDELAYQFMTDLERIIDPDGYSDHIYPNIYPNSRDSTSALNRWRQERIIRWQANQK